MLIKKDELTIRNATDNDTQILCDWWNSGKVMSHAGFPNGLGINRESVSVLVQDGNEKNRILIIEFENTPIGEMNYRTIDENVAEIGIKICDLDNQNRGLGTKFLKMLIDYLFFFMGYKKVNVVVNLTNKRAQYVYEKLGFCKIRTDVDAWKDQLGVWQTSVFYELTAPTDN